MGAVGTVLLGCGRTEGRRNVTDPRPHALTALLRTFPRNALLVVAWSSLGLLQAEKGLLPATLCCLQEECGSGPGGRASGVPGNLMR